MLNPVQRLARGNFGRVFLALLFFMVAFHTAGHLIAPATDSDHSCAICANSCGSIALGDDQSGKIPTTRPATTIFVAAQVSTVATFIPTQIWPEDTRAQAPPEPPSSSLV